MSLSFRVGELELGIVSGGRLRIDGGNMFGVVPRVMWERAAPPDQLNRISLATNCVLVRTRNSLGLVDTGYGGKTTPKQRARQSLEEGQPLVNSLAAVGVAPDDINWVVLTHLHFDHAGGASFRDENSTLQLTFPRARHFIQRAEWEDANANLPELAGAYSVADFAPLAAAGLVELVEGDVEIAPGVRTQLTAGHTRGHQLVRLDSAGDSAVCLADLCPTAAHLPTFWTLAYDQDPLLVRRTKPAILNDIADRRRIALFSHDPQITAARLTRVSADEWETTKISRASGN